MPKPKGDMSQRIKNAGFYNKQQAKSTEAGTGKFSAIKAAKANPLEEMKEALESWLTPEDVAQEGDIIDDEKETDIPKTNYSVNTSSQTVKQNKLDKFDSLFDESSDKADDVPF